MSQLLFAIYAVTFDSYLGVNYMSTPSTSTSANALAALQELYNANQFQKVINVSTDLMKQYPNLHQLHTLRGASFLKLNKIDDAMFDFQKTLEVKPADIGALEGLGMCYEHLGNYNEASRCFAMSLPTKARLPVVRRLAQTALSAVGEDEMARAAFKLICDRLLESIDIPYRTKISTCRPASDCQKINDVEVSEIEPAKDVHLATADGSKLEPYNADAIKIAKISHAYAMTGWDFILTSGGEVLNRSGYIDISSGGAYSFVPHVADKSKKRVLHIWSENVIKIDDDVLFLSAPERFHFGHWIVDFLPRMFAWRNRSRSHLKIFVPSKLPQHLRDTLSLFGVQSNDMIEGEIGQCFKFKTLTMLFPSDEDRLSPDIAKYIYNALGPANPAQKRDVENRIFLQRSGEVRGRHFLNQSELDKVLADFNFETVRRPTLSVSEQNKKFAEAGIVMGAFGTDLVTMYQLRPGTDLIIFLHEEARTSAGDLVGRGIDTADTYVDQLCAVIGIRVHRIYCKLVQTRPGYSYLQDMIVDCEVVKQKLEEIIERRSAESS